MLKCRGKTDGTMGGYDNDSSISGSQGVIPENENKAAGWRMVTRVLDMGFVGYLGEPVHQMAHI
jgi:hypothetical protein